MKKIILDTNCYTAYLAGDLRILQILAESTAVFMSIFVLGELYAGFKGGNREKENQAILHTFLKKPSVTTIDASIETAELFGMVKNMLKQSGRPIPLNDVWIAAHTLECGATLVTRDQHFQYIPGLRLLE